MLHAQLAHEKLKVPIRKIKFSSTFFHMPAWSDRSSSYKPSTTNCMRTNSKVEYHQPKL